MEFEEFTKIPRLSRDITVTEKIDGTNGLIAIFPASEYDMNDLCMQFVPGTDTRPDYVIMAGSRTKWISPTSDNYGFAKWVWAHAEELVIGLGEGKHYGEWWGQGIQRSYGLKEKHFSLFNTYRWLDGGKEGKDVRPACCDVVPVLYRGPFETHVIFHVLDCLALYGSQAAPGFMNPEGVVIYHTAGNLYFKKTIKNDEMPKSLVKE